MYTIHCSCGIAHSVAGTDAGRSIPCSCGKKVEIPSFGKLRQMGTEAQEIEWEIESKLDKEELPEEANCIICQRATRNYHEIHVQCEWSKKQVESTPSLMSYIFFYLTFGFVGMLFARLNQETTRIGRDIEFDLPIRICPECQDDKKRPSDRVLLSRIPLYSRLMKAFPNAAVNRDDKWFI